MFALLLTLAAQSPITLGPVTELFDALDREVSDGSSKRIYWQQPSMARDENGVIRVCSALVQGHGSAVGGVTCIGSSDDGVTWNDKRSYTDYLHDSPYGDFGSIALADGHLLLDGVRILSATVSPTRVSWTAYASSGVSFASKVDNVRPRGTRHTNGGTGPVFRNTAGDLLQGVYWRDCTSPGNCGTVENRYTSSIFTWSASRSLWIPTATIARDALASGNQYEEPQCQLDRTRPRRIYCLIRVDNLTYPGYGYTTETGSVLWAESLDDGATFGTTHNAFPGQGTSPFLQLSNGPWIATTRGMSNTTEGKRGRLYYSLDRGQTWSYHGEFQEPQTGGLTPWGGKYTSTGMLEISRGVVLAVYGQESTDTENDRASLFARLIVAQPRNHLARSTVTLPTPGTAPTPPVATSSALTLIPALPNYYYSTHCGWIPATGTHYVTYPSSTILNGVSSWTMQYRFYFLGDGTRMWANAGERPTVFSRSTQFALTLAPSRALAVYIRNGGSNAIWTSETGNALLVNHAMATVTVTFNGGTVRLYVDGTELTGTYSGAAMPIVMSSPSTTWQIGADTNANLGSRITPDDIAVWPSVVAAPEAIPALAALGNLNLASIGTPAVWLPLDNSWVDSKGTLGTATLTGSPVFTQRHRCARPAAQ